MPFLWKLSFSWCFNIGTQERLCQGDPSHARALSFKGHGDDSEKNRRSVPQLLGVSKSSFRRWSKPMGVPHGAGGGNVHVWPAGDRSHSSAELLPGPSLAGFSSAEKNKESHPGVPGPGVDRSWGPDWIQECGLSNKELLLGVPHGEKEARTGGRGDSAHWSGPESPHASPGFPTSGSSEESEDACDKKPVATSAPTTVLARAVGCRHPFSGPSETRCSDFRSPEM
mmetsp:Transcript_14213/g.40386  ORF Transcript_14213/g.40386 Transcript_14213/m.40386 type:complete len:226 (+) Transcript_14213:1103-1780(+)